MCHKIKVLSIYYKGVNYAVDKKVRMHVKTALNLDGLIQDVQTTTAHNKYPGQPYNKILLLLFNLSCVFVVNHQFNYHYHFSVIRNLTMLYSVYWCLVFLRYYIVSTHKKLE